MNTCIKTMVISLLLILSMPMAKLSAQVSVWDGTWEPWTHGTGTEADPFLIENARQLAYLAYRVNNGLDAGGGHVSNHDLHYKLMVDVDLNGSEDFQWTPIGSSSDTYYQCFGGYFNGNGHIVLNMYVNTNYSAGFFGNVDGATIKNMGVYGFVNNSADSGSQCAGGIVGYSLGAIIENCFNSADVSSNNCSGGIVGRTESGTTQITNCYNTGNISIYNGFAGGIMGGSWSFELIIIITNCYNLGELHGYNLGGIFGGGNVLPQVNNSHYLNTCGGNNICGGAPQTEIYMKSSEFVNLLNGETCAWEYDYNNANSGYPILTMIIVDVVTSDATSVLNTSAVLKGSVFTENASVLSQGFEYKKVSDYNYQIINASGNGNISKPLSGLQPDTQYQYRAFCITNNCGSHYGDIKTFSTIPVIVTTRYATDVTTTSAILNGSIYIGNATLTNKGFEYRAIGETDYNIVDVEDNNNPFSTQITGLQLNTTYEYRAFMNIAESSITYYGETRTFEVTLLNLDTIPINNAEMLRWVSEQCNSGNTFEGKCIKLMNDITLPLNVPNNMTSIGSYPDHPFKGTFDGNGMLITNLYIDQPNTPYQGFFGYTLNANLYNVGLVNITASGRNYTGGMVAYAENTHMRDCYVNGGTLFALSYCGGLVGYQEQGTNSIISGCYNTCTVSGNHYVGGLVGFSNYGTVRNSYVAAPVSGQGNGIGAIIGGANEVLMYYCFFSTEITGQTNAIGENNFKDGEGMTNAQMRDPQFVNTLNQGLVTPVWMADYTTQINNGFPILKWQHGINSPCQPPTNLMVNEVGGTSVKLSWQSVAGSYVVAYGKDGVYNQTITTTENNIRLEGLQLNTDYVWKIKAICGEYETDYVIGQPFRTLGTGVGENNMLVSISPNPTTDKVAIEAEKLRHITISNMLGQIIYSDKAEGNAFEYDFSNHNAGIYLIRIETESGVAVKKVLVER